MLAFLFEYEFAQRALVIGFISGLITPMIGLFIVARRLSVISEALSHMSLSGIALGSLVGSFVPFLDPISPPMYGFIFSVIGALFVEWLSRVYRDFSEIAIPILISFGIGLTVLLFSMMGGLNVDFAGYLFGNLMAVSKTDLQMSVMIGIIVISVVLILYHQLFMLTFDHEYAKVIGVRSRLLQLIFMVIMALTISMMVRAVGVLLVTGLMIIPVASGMMMASGFKMAMVYSIIISEISVISGFILSYYFDIASGGTIIMVALILLLVIIIKKRIVARLKM